MDIIIEKFTNTNKIRNSDLLFTSDEKSLIDKGIIISRTEDFVKCRKHRFFRFYSKYHINFMTIHISDKYKSVENNSINIGKIHPYIRITLLNIKNKKYINVYAHKGIINDTIKNNMHFISDIHNIINIYISNLLPYSLTIADEFVISPKISKRVKNEL